MVRLLFKLYEEYLSRTNIEKIIVCWVELLLDTKSLISRGKKFAKSSSKKRAFLDSTNNDVGHVDLLEVEDMMNRDFLFVELFEY